LERLWKQCDHLQQAIEVVHSTDDRYQHSGLLVNTAQSRPGTRRALLLLQPSILGLFFYSYTMPQDLKAQLKQFVPPEPTRIESVETLPPALSRTLLEYGYTSRKRQSTTVELPFEKQSRWLAETCKPYCDWWIWELPSVTKPFCQQGQH